jgi:hypothetical protein
LRTHIEELEEASKDENPAKFKLAFNSFKVFVVRNWTRIDYDLDTRTRRQIEEVFEIENSPQFKIYQFVSENLDYFARYVYIACFALFVCVKMSKLYNLLWLNIVSPIVFGLSVIFYGFIHVKLLMIENEWRFGKAFNHYVKLRCIFPRT